MIATVTRFIEFDAGHRVARHESKCRHLHGHRYRLTVHVEGPIKDDDSAEHGMVIDFGRIKEALMIIHDEFDHRFIVGQDDPLATDLKALPGVVIIDRQPTAENLASIALERLSKILDPLNVIRVDIEETSSCTASASF